LEEIKITISKNAFVIDPDTKDPLARAVIDSLGKGQEVSDYVTSVYIEARKAGKQQSCCISTGCCT